MASVPVAAIGSTGELSFAVGGVVETSAAGEGSFAGAFTTTLRVAWRKFEPGIWAQ